MNSLVYNSDTSVAPKSWKSIFQYWDVIPFLGIHLMCIWAFQTGIRLEWVVLGIASYYLRMFAVTAGYHRYFSHRSYKTSRVFQFLLAEQFKPVKKNFEGYAKHATQKLHCNSE